MRVLLRIIGLNLRHKGRLFSAYACMVAASIAYLYLPKVFGSAIDKVADAVSGGEVSESEIFKIVLLILGLSIVRGVFSFGQTYLGEALAQFVTYDLRNRFYNHVQHMSFGFHDRYHTGNLMSRAIADVENIRMFIHMGVIRTPYFFGLFIVVGIILMRMDWQLGLVSVGFMPFMMVQSAFIRIKIRRIWLRIQARLADLNTVLQENLTGVRVVKAFAAEEHEQARFNSRSRAVSKDTVEAEVLRAWNNSFMLFSFLVSMGLIVWFGGWRVMNGHLTPGEMAQFIFYMQILAMPVRMVGFLVHWYARAAAAGDRLFEILDSVSPVHESPTAVEMPRARGHVRFETAGFGYDGAREVLRKVDFEVEPGKVVALLGAPGSGKTTIVSLIPRFYDLPESGSITIDGTDIRDVTLASLRHNIGIVQQDVFLFTTTIAENIAYGREDASMDEIVQAAKVAQLHDFIESMEDGYQTIIGERGSTLSGGQRQRMSIARAVLLDPPILILDDSTSSVDTRTEDLIRKAMESVMRGRTTFVIAHRLSTVHKADMILVLEDGSIIEKGTHQELLELGGQYREIYDLQLRPQEEVLREVEVPALGEVSR